jgi:hypothetical protein
MFLVGRKLLSRDQVMEADAIDRRPRTIATIHLATNSVVHRVHPLQQ